MKSILIIDDDAKTRFALRALVESAGYCALEAGNSEEAMAVVDTRGLPHLILLDLKLPGKSGVQFAVEISTNPLFNNIPIIVVSGLVQMAAKLKGVLAFFSKPVDSDLLLEKINEVLRVP